jgi:hypothetical protein
LCLVLGGPCFAGSTNLFSVPVMLVTPQKMNFGQVASGTTVTNTFIVENVGSGKLVGGASVALPFKIISGEQYSLKYGAAQLVRITYTPSGATTDQATVKFTGGNGAKVAVVGKPASSRWTR